MSKSACNKEILCLGKAINDLDTVIAQLEFKRTKAINEYGTLDIEDVELGTKQADFVMSQCKKIISGLME